MPDNKPSGIAYTDPRVDDVTFTPVLVAQLPVPNVSIRGMRMAVTNANATLTAGIGAVVAAGGANVVPVFCDGTNWRIG
jgi:hypothetical protein